MRSKEKIAIFFVTFLMILTIIVIIIVEKSGKITYAAENTAENVDKVIQKDVKNLKISKAKAINLDEIIRKKLSCYRS